METEIVEALATYEVIEDRAVSLQPIKRVGRPIDIANAVAFLASAAQASSLERCCMSVVAASADPLDPTARG
jgi:NAD(P)-dependent dehydrogenase (short-subunit alcohol dehydrogenase family)